MPIIILAAIILYFAGSWANASWNLAEWSELSRTFCAGSWLAVSGAWGCILYLTGGDK